jgi:hypothetical protein
MVDLVDVEMIGQVIAVGVTVDKGRPARPQSRVPSVAGPKSGLLLKICVLGQDQSI